MTDKEREIASKAAEDLSIVRSIMEGCAARQEDSGIYMVVWGLLVPFAAGLNYFLVNLGLWNLSGPLWAVVMIAGGILSFAIGRRRRGERVSSRGGLMQASVWAAGWVGILVVLAVGFISGRMGLNSMMLFIGCSLAAAFFVSGFMSGTSVMKLAACGWWIAGITAFFSPVYSSPLVIAGATVLFTFIPGLILDKKYRSH